MVEEYSSQSETEEEESKHYCKFAEQGSEAVKTMTGFTTTEFLELYGVVEKSLKVTGRGKRPEIGPLDSFFLTLVMLKHYESWDKFALNHGIKRNVVMNCIHKTLTKIKEPLKESLLPLVTKDEQMKRGIKLDDYPEVGLIVDVTFQVRTKPKMLFKEAQFYFSGKHSAYGFKTEVRHLPNGLAVFIIWNGKIYGIESPISLQEFKKLSDSEIICRFDQFICQGFIGSYDNTISIPAFNISHNGKKSDFIDKLIDIHIEFLDKVKEYDPERILKIIGGVSDGDAYLNELHNRLEQYNIENNIKIGDIHWIRHLDNVHV